MTRRSVPEGGRGAVLRWPVIAKVHGLAVAEHARGQGIAAAALLKRAWQI
ncbi:hypothetical protein [Streptomyces sp. WAC00263]|nr:hypothetical protein [Streptomyces sp. WAC00263]